MENNLENQSFMDRLFGAILKFRLPKILKRGRDETEFLPAALEIIETPPSPSGRIVTYIIIAFFTLALAWANFASIDIIALAQGKIIPTGRTKLIQPLESGVVRSIKVQDGQQVKSGDVLLEIDATITEAERDKQQQDYVEQQLIVARLVAATHLDNPLGYFKSPDRASADQIATARDLLSNQVQGIKSKLQGLDSQIAQQRGNLDAVQSTIDKLESSLPYLKQKSDARASLAAQGYGAKLDTLNAQQDFVEHQKELEVTRGRVKEAMGSLRALQDQRQQAEAEYKQRTLQDLAEAQQKAAALKQAVVQATERFKLQTLTAPVDGTVQQLAVHTEGGVVTPAQVLMVIVPADSKLEIDASISNQDIGFVHAGQEVAIKVDTFNFTKYGLLSGRIISVSSDAIVRDRSAPRDDTASASSGTTSSEPKTQDLVYQARIALDQTQLRVDDRLVNLAPGMSVTAEIKTGKRKILEYLLSPLQKHAQESLRER